MKKTHTTQTHTRIATGTEAVGAQARYRPTRSARAEAAFAAVQSAHHEAGDIARLRRTFGKQLALAS